MALLTFNEVSLAFGAHKILRQTDFAIEPGERVCLIGRNGAGKTTVLRLIAGTLEPDHGEVIRQSGLEISRLEQTLPVMTDVSVAEYVAGGLQRLRGLIAEYEARARTDLDDIGVRELEALQRNIETHGGWNIDQRVATVLSELDIPPDKHLNELSGGWQRRVALAKALVNRPELLLLDEPTNHLDLHTIQWLEKRVRNYPGSVLFITHDRAFLQKLATRIVDIDRGQIKSWPGDYRAYRRGKEKAMEDERRHNGLFDKKLAEEEIWVRQGLKARRTRNEGRVRALQSMRDERAQRIKPDGQARIHVEEAERSGRKVIDARNLHFRYGEQPLIEGLSVRIMRGDRIGLIGNNGVGKSTLLNILLGRLQPQAGTVKLGTNLKLGYFDQVRRILDPTRTVAEFVGDGRDYIKLNGKERHVIGYLRGFLFSANRAMEPLSVLSGGERNRVILAKLFTRPTNLLVLDEPTNDLDVETLEVLEERLAEYVGTLIVVSHDRAFLDNVVTSTLVFENAGEIRRYAGGYNDWLKQGHSLTHVDDPDDDVARPAASANTTSNEQRRKLSYKLKHELEQLPNRIELLEKELDELHGQTNRRGFFDQPFEATQPLIDRLRACQGELDDAMMRWSELETMQSELGG